jgi:putative flippase GtrA
MQREQSQRVQEERLIVGEFCRYVVVGGAAFACDFLTYWGLTDLLQVNYLLANIVGFCLGLTVNYLLSIYWVFCRRSQPSIRREFALFAAIGLLNLGLGEASLWLLVALGELHHLFAKVLVTGLVFLCNFCLRKVLLFHVPAT